MLSKSDDPAKLQALAAKMVKSIKHLDKMVRRYKAAAEIAGIDSVITQEFTKGYAAMANGEPDPVIGSVPATPKPEPAPVAKPVPVEPEEEVTDFNAAIQDEIVKVSPEKNEVTVKNDDWEEVIKFADGEHNDQMNISPESIKLYQRIIRHFSKKLIEYDIQRKFDEAADHFKNTSKRYKIKSLAIDGVDFLGNVIVSGEMNTREQVRSKSWTKSNYYMTTVTWRFYDMKYQFFSGKWNLSEARYKPTTLHYDESLANSKSQDKEKCLPMLGAFQKQIEKIIEKDHKIKAMLLQFNKIVDHYFGTSFENVTFDRSFLRINNSYSYKSKFKKMIEYIYEQIEEKFGYSDEPDVVNPNKWKGYAIVGIDDENVYFSSRNDRFATEELKHVVAMLKDIGISKPDPQYREKARLTHYIPVPIDELIEVIK